MPWLTIVVSRLGIGVSGQEEFIWQICKKCRVSSGYLKQEFTCYTYFTYAHLIIDFVRCKMVSQCTKLMLLVDLFDPSFRVHAVMLISLLHSTFKLLFKNFKSCMNICRHRPCMPWSPFKNLICLELHVIIWFCRIYAVLLSFSYCRECYAMYRWTKNSL